MGFLDILKAIGPAIGSVSSVLGKQRQGAATGRVAEAEAGQAQDRNALSLYSARQAAENQAAQTDLERKRYSDTARGTNANRAVIAALLSGGHMGGSISVPGVRNATVTGGPLAALAQSPDALAALKELGAQSSSGLTSPAPFTGGAMVAPPSLTALPKESGGGRFLDILANIGQLAGSVSPYLKRRGQSAEGQYGIENVGG